MKLLIDARPLVDRGNGGVYRLSVELVRAYAAAFPDDRLFCMTTGMTQKPLPEELSRHPNVTRVHLTIPNKLWSFLTWIGVVSFQREAARRVGALDATFFPNIGFIGTTPYPYVLLLHDFSFLIEPRWFSLRRRWWHEAVHATSLIRKAHKLFAVSETTKRDAMRLLNIPAENIAVIPVGATLAVARAGASPAPTKDRYVLALGWNDPRKNAKTAYAAVDILRRDSAYADLKLIAIGRDVIRPTDEALSSLYANASAFLYPSWYEGYGLPLHEAAAYGTPRVASTAGALPETAPPGTLFANPGKPHHWAEALRIALALPRSPVMAQPSDWHLAAEKLGRALH